MGNPNLPDINDHNITTETEWDSLTKVSRADLPTSEIDTRRAPGYFDLSQENIEKNETNLNSKTGKERTFSDMDLYARQKITDENGNERYETAQEQGEQRKGRNDMITWTELIPYDDFRRLYGRDETSSMLNQAYTGLIKKLVEKYPREEDEELADYRERAKGIVESILKKYYEPVDRQSEQDRLKEKISTAAEKGKITQHNAENLNKVIDRYIDKKEQQKEREGREALIKELLHPEGSGGNSLKQADNAESQADKKTVKIEEEEATKAEEFDPSKLDPEILRWYNDRMGDVDYGGGRKLPEKEEKRLKDMIRNDAINMQAAADKERAAALDLEAAAAKEREAAAAKEREVAAAEEREVAAAEERAKAKALEEIQQMFDECDEILQGKTVNKKDQELERTENDNLIDKVDQELKKLDEIEKSIKSRQKSGLALWVASIFSRIKRRKKVETSETPKKEEKVEANTDNSEEAKKSEETEEAKKESMHLFPEDEEFHTWSSIGEDGIEIMGDNEPLTEEKTPAIEQWWDSLDENAQEGVKNNKDFIGRTLFTFLQNKGVIAENIEGFFGGDKEEDMARDRVEYLKGEYHYWNSIGKEGVNYLIGRVKPNDENAGEIVSWWNSLDSTVKERIKQEDFSFILGIGLCSFLQNRADAIY